MNFFIGPLASVFCTCSIVVSCQSCFDHELASIDEQCLIQSHRFRRGTSLVSDDVDIDDEARQRENEEADNSILIEIEKSIGCKGTDAKARANVKGFDPRCKTVTDCKSSEKKGIACISGLCTDPLKVKFDWSSAILDSYCPCHDLGKSTMGRAHPTDCKKKCEEMDTCTGFTWGKSGDVESMCWFFSTCTKTTAMAQLKKDTTGKFDVFFLSAHSEIEAPVISFRRQSVVFRGRAKPPDGPAKCLSAGNCNDIPNVVVNPPIECTDGVCHDSATEKFTWTFAIVNQMCQIRRTHFLGELAGKVHKIIECKRACEKRKGCTGFNRGKRGPIRGHCSFFSNCGKYTPAYFKTNTRYNMYFVTGASTIPIPFETFETRPVLLRG